MIIFCIIVGEIDVDFRIRISQVGGEPSSLASSLSSRFSWHEWSVKWSPEEKEEEEEDGDGGESVSHRANVELTHGLRFGIYGKRCVVVFFN